ncbi:MAG: bifunctional folylpolyglutamate synthase/dihydrofolate synthase [Lachnospiraceae bacterium]|nr:bifunctional folylpolyglutamate synthase/dihydrofolate synthase [Lachnospiraceae bacterium]
MNYKQAMEYMDSCKVYGISPGLDCIRELLRRLGDPQKELRFIHIAGTNGKGSTLFFVSNCLTAHGWKVGRFLSPVIFSYEEQFQVNGKPISKAMLGRLTGAVARAAEDMAEEGLKHPTVFEMETALAFLFFREKKCEIVVLETGMGGLMDATNVIETPLVAVLTHISRDHMAYLGDTLEEIVAQKAGIIKKDCRVVAMENTPETEACIRKRAAEAGAKEVVFVRQQDVRDCHFGLGKQRFSYGRYQDMEITLAGIHQVMNAALALEVTEAFGRQGFSLSEECMRRGMGVGSWPARFQILQKSPLFLADSAHNEEGARQLRRSLQFYFTNKRFIYIMGMFRDKECDKIIDATCDLAEYIITVQAKGNPRALPALELAQRIALNHDRVTAADSIEEAVEMAHLLAERDTVIVAFGSLAYMGDCIREVERRKDRKGTAAWGGAGRRGRNGK